MNNLVPIPFVIFGILVLVTVIAIMRGEGKVRAGSSKSLSGSLSKILMGSSKKSSKKSSGGKKYMGFTMTQLLVGGAVIAGLYYYNTEGYKGGEEDKGYKGVEEDSCMCKRCVEMGSGNNTIEDCEDWGKDPSTKPQWDCECLPPDVRARSLRKLADAEKKEEEKKEEEKKEEEKKWMKTNEMFPPLVVPKDPSHINKYQQ